MASRVSRSTPIVWNQPQLPLFKVSYEVLLNIMSYLPISSIRNMKLSCRDLAQLGESPILFRNLLNRDFKITEPNDDMCISTYQITHETDRNMRTGKYRFSELGDTPLDIWSSTIVGNTFVAGLNHGACMVWDLKTRTCTHLLQGHKDRINHIELHEGKLYTCSWDNTCKVWDWETKQCLHTFKGHSGAIKCMKISNGKLITGSDDCTCKVWDLNTYECLYTLEGHPDPISHLDAQGDKLVATSFTVGTCKYHCWQAWDLSNGKLLHRFVGSGGIGAVKVLDDLFITAGIANHGRCEVWNFKTGERINHYDPYIASINCLEVRGDWAILGGADQWKSWNFKTGETVSSDDSKKIRHVIGCMKIEGNKIITSSYWNNVSLIWDLRTGQLLQILKSPELDLAEDHISLNGIKVLEFHESKIITGGSGDPCRIWDFNLDYPKILKDLAEQLSENASNENAKALACVLDDFSQLPLKFKKEILVCFFKEICPKLTFKETDLKWTEQVFCDCSRIESDLNQSRAHAILKYLEEEKKELNHVG